MADATTRWRYLGLSGWHPTRSYVRTTKRETLGALLLALPRLRSLTLAGSLGRYRRIPLHTYGLSWDVLKTIMSAAPGLRELNLDKHHFAPDAFSHDSDLATPPLTAFRCLVPHVRVGPRI